MQATLAIIQWTYIEGSSPSQWDYNVFMNVYQIQMHIPMVIFIIYF